MIKSVEDRWDTQRSRLTSARINGFKCYKIVNGKKTTYMAIENDMTNVLTNRFDGIMCTAKMVEPMDKWVLKRGIVLVRRDRTQWMKNIYNVLCNNILFGIKMEESFEFVFQNLLNLKRGLVPINDLTITKKVGTAYKQDTNMMKVFQDTMGRWGVQLKRERDTRFFL